MDPMSAFVFGADVIDFVSSAVERLRGERITRPRDIVASFTELQAARIFQIQSEIIKLFPARLSEQLAGGAPLFVAEVDLQDRLGEALHKYAQALRDYETLSQESLSHNPFEIPKWRSRMPELVREVIKPHLAPYPEIEPFVDKLNLRELDKRGRLLRGKKYAALERLLLGSFGGIMLIAPMLLMVLDYNRNTTLITTSVATVLFTLVLAIFARGMAGKDVLGAVAAYAAVLVVFVGTSIAPPSSA